MKSIPSGPDIIVAGVLHGKLVRSDRAVEGRTGAGTQRSPAHRRSFGSTRQQLEAHGHGSEREEAQKARWAKAKRG